MAHIRIHLLRFWYLLCLIDIFVYRLLVKLFLAVKRWLSPKTTALVCTDAASGDLSPLEVNEVIRSICRHLSFQELLICSEINKSWNFECRLRLRDHHKAVANIGGFCLPCCKNLKIFNEHLRKMRVVPYTGIRVSLKGWEWDRDNKHGDGDYQLDCLHLRELDKSFESILWSSKLQLKSLFIDCYSISEDYPDLASLDCTAAKLVIKLLEMHGETLEYLEVGELCVEATLLPVTKKDKVTEGGMGEPPTAIIRLPNLKTLLIAPTTDFPLPLVLQVLPMAPNLENFYVQIDSRHLPMLPPETLKIVRELTYAAHSERDVEIYGQLAALDPRLKLVEARCNFEFDDENTLDDAWSYLLHMFKSSEDTLESIYADSSLLVMLELTRLSPLRLVGELHLQISRDSEQLEAIFDLLSCVDFDFLFPSLNRIEIATDTWYNFQYDEEEYYQRFNFPASEPLNSKITEIDLDDEYVKEEILISGLVDVFPSVEVFYYRRGKAAVDFTELWRNAWPNLKKLYIWIREEAINLDAVFCGIHPEEADALRCKSDKFLRSVHIVPIAPAVDNLKELQIITIQLDRRAVKLGVKEEKPALSKVASAFMQQRMQKLKVHICPPRGKF